MSTISFPAMPGSQAPRLEELMEQLNVAIKNRARFSEERIHAGESSPEDSREIARYDGKITELCRSTCLSLPMQTETGLLESSLRQLVRGKEISQQAADNILEALKGELKTIK